MIRFQVDSWDHTSRALQYDWAGRLVRDAMEDPGRYTEKVLKFKDLTSIVRFAEQNAGWQGHAKRFHAWRWGQGLFNVLSNLRFFMAYRCSVQDYVEAISRTVAGVAKSAVLSAQFKSDGSVSVHNFRDFKLSNVSLRADLCSFLRTFFSMG